MIHTVYHTHVLLLYVNIMQKIWSDLKSSSTEDQKQELCLKTFRVNPICLPPPSLPLFLPASLSLSILPIHLSCSPIPYYTPLECMNVSFLLLSELYFHFMLIQHSIVCVCVCVLSLSLQFMLKEWAAELNSRPMTDKRSYQVMHIL